MNSLNYRQGTPSVLNEQQASAFIQYASLFSSVTTDSFYVWNIPRKQFDDIKPDGLFLCGFSVEEVLDLGYDFYPQIVHSEDLVLWTDMHKAVLRCLANYKGKHDEIDYFSCTFRLQRKCSFVSRPLPQMVYQRMKPVWIADRWAYLICTIKSSTSKEAGNLHMHFNDGLSKTYSLTTKRWKQQMKKSLTERERMILMLAQQGKSTREIADVLCKAHDTIRNQIKLLFVKLNLHTMQEAIDFVGTHRMIYTK